MTATNGVKVVSTESRALRIAVLIFTALLLPLSILSVVLTVRSTSESAPAPQAFYLQKVFEAERAELCPGETLVIAYSYEVTSAPSVFHVLNSLWDVTNRRTLVPASDDQAYIFPEIGVYNDVVMYSIPTWLEPGSYQYRRAVEQRFTASDMFTTSFIIKEDCQE